MEQTAKASQTELQKGLAILENTLNWLKNIGVQNNWINQDIVALRTVHENTTDQSTVQFKAQQEELMELTKMVEATDANRESQMETLTRLMTELFKKHGTAGCFICKMGTMGIKFKCSESQFNACQWQSIW